MTDNKHSLQLDFRVAIEAPTVVVIIVQIADRERVVDLVERDGRLPGRPRFLLILLLRSNSRMRIFYPGDLLVKI